MKDFYDLWCMINVAHLFDRTKLKEALKATFSNRETSLQNKIEFADSEMQLFENGWRNFRAAVSIADTLPAELKTIVEEINIWVSALLAE